MCHLCLSLMDIVLFEMFSTTLLALNIFLYPSNRIFFGHAKERQMNTCKRITDVKRPLFFPNYHERNLHMPTLVMLSMCWFTSSSCSLSPFVTDYWLVKEKKEKNLWKRMKERRRDLLGEGWLCVFDCVVIAQEDGQWRCTSPTKSLNDGKDKSIGRVDESISSRLKTGIQSKSVNKSTAISPRRPLNERLFHPSPQKLIRWKRLVETMRFGSESDDGSSHSRKWIGSTLFSSSFCHHHHHHR